MSTSPLPPPPSLQPARIALFLDVDGTLAEIVQEPSAVRIPGALRQTLQDLQAATGGALALVSGRPISELDQLFAPLALCAGGLHGLERRLADGTIERATPAPAVFDAPRAQLQAFADAHEGVVLEDKGLSLALHYRRAPATAAAAQALAHGLAAASGGGLTLLEGKMVFELKPPGYDKGAVIRAFMGSPPFSGRQPVFAGDDVTDEAGFASVNELDGVSIRIGINDRSTAARYGHQDVPAMQAWLNDVLAASP